VKLRGLANDQGLTLNEWGLYKISDYEKGTKKTGEAPSAKPVAGLTEESVYKALGLPCIVPEMREDRGEIELAESGKLPKLIERKDIRGELHCHTTASDGTATIEEMAEAAKALGYEYIAITDHSQSSVIANGLSAQRMRAHIQGIHRARGRVKGIHILAGAEVDILIDGRMDYDQGLLAELDLVVGSPHASLKQDAAKATDRILRAIETRYVNIIGHPTGRMINQREGLPLDMGKVIEAAAETGTALEINAGWPRWDLNDLNARAAWQKGVMLAIDTDAHHPSGMGDMEMGLWIARRAWVEPKHVINCLPFAGLQAFLKKKR
jgi:DNA polymerase (family 10)